MYSVGIEGRANGAVFSTKDRDHSADKCSKKYHGGWWYTNCEYSDINGQINVNGNPIIMDWRVNLGQNVSKSMMMITKY